MNRRGAQGLNISALTIGMQMGPDGRPPVFEGGAWISQDRRYWWNGSAWQPLNAPPIGFPFVQVGLGILFVACIGYVVYTSLATASAYTIGFYVGVTAFFGILIIIFRFVGRWGCFGIAIRGMCVFLAILKILTLIAHPPPA